MKFNHNVLYGDRLYMAGEDVPMPCDCEAKAPSQPVSAESPKEEAKPVKKSKAKK